MKRITMFFIVLSLLLALFSSCVQKSSDEIATDTEDTTEEIEYNIPDGLDKELYMAAREALIQLDDETMEELKEFKEMQGVANVVEIDESTGGVSYGVYCLGKFDDCIVLYERTSRPIESTTRYTVAGYKFVDDGFTMWGYCDGNMYQIQTAYELGYVSKADMETVYERYLAIIEYRTAWGARERYLEVKSSLIELDESKKKEIEKAFDKEIEWIEPANTYDAWNNKMLCYGEFENCTVLLLPNLDSRKYTSIKIDGTTISLPFDFCIYGYHDGTVYDLTKAYELGYISEEEMSVVLNRHKQVYVYMQCWEMIIF